MQQNKTSAHYTGTAQIPALAHPGAADRAVHRRLDHAGYRPQHAGDDADQPAFQVRRADPGGRRRAACCGASTHGEPAPEDGLPPWQTTSARDRALAALSAAVRDPDPGLDQCRLARHAGRDVRPRNAEADRDARARLALDRRRARPVGELRAARPGRPARRWPRSIITSSAATACCSACCRG